MKIIFYLINTLVAVYFSSVFVNPLCGFVVFMMMAGLGFKWWINGFDRKGSIGHVSQK
jgi:hypothetical protein